jgi:hypothetical protein
MKKGLLGSTALIGATALIAGTAGAAEAPTWKLTGNANFQFYYADADAQGVTSVTNFFTSLKGTVGGNFFTLEASTGVVGFDRLSTAQDHAWYFGVDEAELQLNVRGTADNGLNYGFKIELNANTTDSKAADEVRIFLSGGWGHVHMGDEDGAEDVMNYGGENLMGATGGFDGDYDDVLLRLTSTFASKLAPSYPTIAGDTSDNTKISYYTPRFSGFQVGASLTPTPGLNGDDFKQDGSFENHYGLGANYDNSFGDMRLRLSGVYSAASSNSVGTEDIAAWSLGGIVDFGPFAIAANYTDNGDSGSPVSSVWTYESWYWNTAASFETGPWYFSAGYMASEKEFSGTTCVPGACDDSTFEVISLTADYSIAPGLSTYAEIDLIEDDVKGSSLPAGSSSDATIFIAGMNVSF